MHLVGSGVPGVSCETVGSGLSGWTCESSGFSGSDWSSGSGVELWNRKVGKSLKIGKNRIKLEKSDLISYLTFWQKCQNAINCHKMPKCLHFGSGSCIRGS